MSSTPIPCRIGCAACCEAPSISSALPGLPGGKPAGVVCPALDRASGCCTVWGGPDYPPVCRAFTATAELCGVSRAEALDRLAALERATAPERVALVTGFVPFAGDEVNPSWQAVAALPERVGPWRVDRALLPVSYRAAWPALERAIDRTRPALVLCTGLAAKRRGISVERVALNLDDATIPDNDGEIRLERPIDPAAPAALWCPLPVRALADRIAQAGIPAEVSTSAGSFVCNHVLFRLLRRIAGGSGPAQAGFLHVPATPELPGRTDAAPGLPLPRIVEALAIALAACGERPAANPQALSREQPVVSG